MLIPFVDIVLRYRARGGCQMLWSVACPSLTSKRTLSLCK